VSDWIQKAKDFVKGHPDQAQQGLDKAEEMINERTGGKYADRVDQGSDRLKETLGVPADGEPGQPPVDPSVPGGAGQSEVPPMGEPAGEHDLPGVPDPNLPGGDGDVTLGDPPAPQR